MSELPEKGTPAARNYFGEVSVALYATGLVFWGWGCFVLGWCMLGWVVALFD